jgi:hypothetical protein
MESRLRRSQSRTREVKCGPKFLAPAPAHSTLGWLVWHQMGDSINTRCKHVQHQFSSSNIVRAHLDSWNTDVKVKLRQSTRSVLKQIKSSKQHQGREPNIQPTTPRPRSETSSTSRGLHIMIGQQSATHRRVLIIGGLEPDIPPPPPSPDRSTSAIRRAPRKSSNADSLLRRDSRWMVDSHSHSRVL